MNLYENVKLIRTVWGESQEKFGARLGMTRSNLSRIESGEYELSLPALRTLSSLTGLSMDRLVDGELTADDILKLPIGEGGEKLQVKEPVPPDYIPPIKKDEQEDANAALLQALAALTAELSAIRKKVEFLERKMEVMDSEMLRLRGKK